MFTGLVKGTGRIVGAAQRRGGLLLTVDAGDLLGDVEQGASIAVDGICLTAVSDRRGTLAFDVSPETLAKSTAGSLRPGRHVNLEPALRMGDPLGGHIVSGHVDGVGRVTGVRKSGAFLEITVSLPDDPRGRVIEKGSIALDGISLTVASLARGAVRVAVIPETAARTTVGGWKAGRAVNVEYDREASPAGAAATLTRAYLADHGFA